LLFVYNNSLLSNPPEKVSTDDSKDIHISFQMATVQINRPWCDLSILRLAGLTLPGLKPEGWSTGKLSPNNNGSMPMFNTQVVLAKDISITANTFSQRVVDYIANTNWHASHGYFVSWDNYLLHLRIANLLVWRICYWNSNSSWPTATNC